MTKEMQNMLDALREKKGLVTYALKISETTRAEHTEWLRDREYAQEIEYIKEEVKDYIEAQLLEAVEDKTAQVLINLAKTKLADRGYSNDNNSGLNVGTILIGYDK